MSPAILMYHRVAELEPDRHRLCTPPARFRAHLEWIARHRTPVPLGSIRTSGDDAVAVTLDDGTVDALEAADILSSFGIPATFFVCGADLERPHESWWDTLERILGDDAEHDRLHARLLHAVVDTREQIMDELLRGLVPRDTHRHLLRDELLALAARFTIGAHGLQHLRLPSLSPGEQHAELAGSRDVLQDLLGRPVRELAYAYGAYDQRVLALARTLGFSQAVTVEDRALGPQEDPLALPRIDAQPLDADALAARLK